MHFFCYFYIFLCRIRIQAEKRCGSTTLLCCGTGIPYIPPAHLGDAGAERLHQRVMQKDVLLLRLDQMIPLAPNMLQIAKDVHLPLGRRLPQHSVNHNVRPRPAHPRRTVHHNGAATVGRRRTGRHGLANEGQHRQRVRRRAMIGPAGVVILGHAALAADPFLLLELTVLDAQGAKGVVGHGDLAEQGHLNGTVGQGALLGPVLVTLPPGPGYWIGWGECTLTIRTDSI